MLESPSMAEFQKQKCQRLERVDLSRKGSVDEPVGELVAFINFLPDYFTTSSCSGRTILFESAVEYSNSNENSSVAKQQSESEAPIQAQMKIGKKGCKWLFVSHGIVSSDECNESFSKVTSCAGNAVFKFEAMVMHIQCETLEVAQQMHKAAVAAGFRNSGISVGGKKKIIVGVRSTHGLEAPLTKDGRVLVTAEYYQHLVECANHKMEENFIRINRFFDNVKALNEGSSPGGHWIKRKKRKGKSVDQADNESPLSSPLCNSNADTVSLYDEDIEMPLFTFEFEDP